MVRLRDAGLSCGIINQTCTSRAVGPFRDATTRTLTNVIAARDTCVREGDGGGPVFMADLQGAAGMVSAGSCSGEAVYEPIWRSINTYAIYPYGG